MPPKSILKKTADQIPISGSLPVPKTDQEKRNLEVAIEHARLIQEQKEVLIQILDAIEELSEYPASNQCTQAEARRFASLVTFFQPSDYDALIEERHANGRCGHTLCPNSHRTVDSKRSWIRPKGSENWCSDGCAKKALYVKAQLNEAPAWERRGGSAPSIVLYEESKASVSSTSAAVNRLDASQDAELATERGEKASSLKPGKVLSAQIAENKTPVTATAPSVSSGGALHELVEGYQPQRSNKKAIDATDIDSD